MGHFDIGPRGPTLTIMPNRQMINRWLKYCGLCMALILLGGSWAGASSPVRMGHELTVRLEPSDQLLRATDVVTVSHAKGAYLVFELAEHMTLEAVALNGRDTRFSFNNGRFWIPFEVAAKHHHLTMVYVGRFTDLEIRLAVKIHHYGKYSYLIFKDSRNQVKGIWAVTDSPMVVRWPKDPDEMTGGMR